MKPSDKPGEFSDIHGDIHQLENLERWEIWELTEDFLDILRSVTSKFNDPVLDELLGAVDERMNFKVSGIPDDTVVGVLNAVVPIIKSEQLAVAGGDPDKAVTELIDSSYAKAVIK